MEKPVQRPSWEASSYTAGLGNAGLTQDHNVYSAQAHATFATLSLLTNGTVSSHRQAQLFICTQIAHCLQQNEPTSK